MDASSRKMSGLISEMNVRLKVPVYQRPYSWEEAQCVQLWDDILASGRTVGRTHFTGSIVTIQDGTLSDQGVATLLLIDGQQRITTILLLLIALARYASAHAGEDLPFSRDEIVLGGYLTNRFRTGEDHYKLELSKADRDLFRTLVNNVEDPTVPVPEANSRLLENLALFEARIAALADVGALWAGISRLEIVHVALTQGADDPQVIFESMNSTGKDLSSADLVRNFVLMGHPLAEQRELYQIYWQPIEDALSSVGTSYEESFEDFVRCYLTVATGSDARGAEVYPAFKYHVQFNGYAERDRMRVFCLRLRRFASYYAAVVGGTAPDNIRGDEAALHEVGEALWRIGQLDAGMARPLLMELLDALERHDLTIAELEGIAKVLESYLLRRAVCDCESSAHASFFASLTARVSSLRREGTPVVQALTAMLVNEEEGPRRFPGDAEFAHALSTRDFSGLGASMFLLMGLEGATGVAVGHEGWTVEHVLPLGALALEEWREMLMPDPERDYLEQVGRLGNLVLTRGGHDLQAASLAVKLERVREAGALATSRDVATDGVWNAQAIDARTERLVSESLATWPIPQLSEEARYAYRAHGRAATAASVGLSELFEAGVIQMDDTLVSADLRYAGRASITSTGKIMLSTGELFEDPTAAYERFLGLAGAASGGINGWLYWRLGEGGPTLDELRLRV